MAEPIWILENVVYAIQRRQIAEHGGAEGVRDHGLLESALARPQNLHYFKQPTPDIAELGAAYAYGIVSNHPFIDGNKRTALVVCRLFLMLNGVDLSALESEKYRIFMKLAAGEISEMELASWIASHSYPNFNISH